jgi:hypothetical protein
VELLCNVEFAFCDCPQPAARLTVSTVTVRYDNHLFFMSTLLGF